MAEIQDRPEVAEKATPETTRITLAIEGMTCASCAMRIEKGLKKVAGVEDAAVNLATERATVTLDPTIATTDDLIAKVRATGYDAAPFVERAEVTPVQERTDSTATDNEPHGEIAAEDDPRARDLRRRRNTLILGVALTIPVVLLSMFFMNRFPGENLLLLALTAPVWGYVGWEFHRAAWRSAATLRREHGHAGQPRLDRRVPDERRRHLLATGRRRRSRSMTPPRSSSR